MGRSSATPAGPRRCYRASDFTCAAKIGWCVSIWRSDSGNQRAASFDELGHNPVRQAKLCRHGKVRAVLHEHEADTEHVAGSGGRGDAINRGRWFHDELVSTEPAGALWAEV